VARWNALERPKPRKIDVRFGTWNVRSVYRSGSLKTVSGELEDNIKMDLWEIGFGDVDWIHWAQDRDRWRALVNTVMNLRVP
jgi:hypothetical protein